MPFKKEDESKPKSDTMTTKDFMESTVTVVSTQSGNEILEQKGNEILESDTVPDLTNSFVEAVQQQTVPQDTQAKEGIDPGNFTGFARGVHINQIPAEDLSNFMRASVVARPVRLPSRLNAKAKDPNYRLRWIEMKAEDGRRYYDACEMGYTVATKDDVVGAQVRANSEGKFVDNDLILMKIPAEVIDGYLKYNALKSLAMISRAGNKNIKQAGYEQLAAAKGNEELRKGVASELGNSKYPMTDAFGHSKLEVYTPK